jgi:hypothetical protein
VRVVTQRELASGLLLALLASLLLGESPRADAQRAFQMGLYVDLSEPTLTRADADIPMFGEGQPQPAGRSIMKYKSWAAPILSGENYDWSRIVAVIIDEPYGPQDDPRIDSVIKYPELKTLAPKARFWVNFTMAEANWIGTCRTPQEFNRPYIDVVSADWYYANFSVLQPFYSVVAANPPKPDQQLALVPGTFFRSGKDDPNVQASYLQSYFNFANNANTSCNLSLGSRGVTGSFDGCPVWIVLGWPARGYIDGSTTYVGELDPNAGPIATGWRQEIAAPLRSDLAHQLWPALLAPALQPLLPNN